MSVTIRTNTGDEATISGWEWVSKKASLEIKLSSFLSPYGPSGSDPYPDLTAARNAIAELKKAGIIAKITDEGTPPKYVKNMVY